MLYKCKLYYLFCQIFFLMNTELFGEGSAKSALRVIGGRDAKPEEFPYVVRMALRTVIRKSSETSIHDQSVCTASAITATWTLTAAHCFIEYTTFRQLTDANNSIIHIVNSLVIIYGSSNSEPKDDTNVSKVLYKVRVPQINLRSAQNDVGLLKTEPIAINRYGKLSVVEIAALYGHEVWAMGHGMTNGSNVVDSTLNLNKPLQVVKLLLMPCDEDGQTPDEIQLCAVHKCSESAILCSGDSGGPLIHSSGIVAINSRSFAPTNCHNIHNYPLGPVAVLVNPISLFIDWIVNQVSQT